MGKVFFFLGFFFIAANSLCAPLSSEKAFVFTAHMQKPDEVVVHWKVAPGYHLYPEKTQITVQYQGCSKEGLCYAPVKKTLPITPLKASSHLMLTLLTFFGLGILLAFTPCSLPMIPILSSIIIGQKQQIFSLSLSYVLGMAVTYALTGIAIAWVGSSIQIYFQNPWIIVLFSGLFIFLALSLLGLFEIKGLWQQKVIAFQQRYTGGSHLNAVTMGCLSTLIVSPCITAPFMGALAYITEQGNIILGGSALFALGLGMGLPLLLIGFSAGKYLPKAGPWMVVIQKIFAFILFGTALWMLSRILPNGLTLFLRAGLFLSAAVYLLFSLSSVARVLGGLLAIYSMILFVSVAITGAPSLPISFIDVKNMQQLNQLLAQARQEKKPVLLDFYAEWCESCKQVEKVLSRSEVKSILNDFVLLRVNITDNTAFDQALLKHYQVVAPPTFLFFNQKGQEMKEKRLVGEVDQQSFLVSAVFA